MGADLFSLVSDKCVESIYQQSLVATLLRQALQPAVPVISNCLFAHLERTPCSDFSFCANTLC